jgi:hypothetical protein
MVAATLAAVLTVFVGLTFVAWRRYLWAAEQVPHGEADTCPYSLTEVFGDQHLVNHVFLADNYIADFSFDLLMCCGNFL